KREFAVQRSPLKEKMPHVQASRARSKSASSNTIIGDFPPNSIDVRFNVSAPFFIISDPVFVSPVKEISLTSGCATRDAPAVSPYPCKMLITHFGNSALSYIYINKYDLTFNS